MHEAMVTEESLVGLPKSLSFPVDLYMTKNYYHAPLAMNFKTVLTEACVNAPVAQLVEPAAHNRLVPGSSPGGPTRTTLTAWINELEVLL